LRGAGSSFAVVTSLTLRLHSGDVLRSALSILSLPVPEPPTAHENPEDMTTPPQRFLSQYLAALPPNASVTLFGLDAYFKAYFFIMQVHIQGR